MTVIKLQDGKYEIERDENGLLVGMWRNGEFWKSGLELFAHAQVFHAALDEIERLSVPVINLDTDFMNELREAISKSPRYPHDLPMHIGDVLRDIKEWLASPTDSSLAALRDMLRAEVDRLIAGSAKPIDMILHCPACGMQHIDKAKPCDMGVGCETAGVCYAEAHGEPSRCNVWTNPPHRSHLCHGCGHIWRPADVPTNGVAAIKTQGKNDSPAPSLPKWPYRTWYVTSIGYVVWRDALEGRVPSDPVKAVMDHKVAVFVTESEALAYCEFRNRHG